MRSLEELMNLFHILEEKDNLEYGCYVRTSNIMIILKRLYVLASVLYPDFMKGTDACYYLSEGGRLLDVTGEEALEFGEFIIQYSLERSYVADYMLIYYQNSPFWKSDICSLDFCQYDGKTFLNAEQFLNQEYYRKVFEEKLYKTLDSVDIAEHPLLKFYDLFQYNYGGVTDNCSIISSQLLPYYYREEKIFHESHKGLCHMISSAVSVLKEWLNGFGFSICEDGLDRCYFINCDNSSSYYEGNFSAGCIEHNPAIILAGEVIDRAIFELDSIYHFLPKEIIALKKEVLNNDVGISKNVG